MTDRLLEVLLKIIEGWLIFSLITTVFCCLVITYGKKVDKRNKEYLAGLAPSPHNEKELA